MRVPTFPVRPLIALFTIALVMSIACGLPSSGHFETQSGVFDCAGCEPGSKIRLYAYSSDDLLLQVTMTTDREEGVSIDDLGASDNQIFIRFEEQRLSNDDEGRRRYLHYVSPAPGDATLRVHERSDRQFELSVRAMVPSVHIETHVQPFAICPDGSLADPECYEELERDVEVIIPFDVRIPGN